MREDQYTTDQLRENSNIGLNHSTVTGKHNIPAENLC